MRMKEVQKNLTKNISELFNTAKREIERKNTVIEDLRKQLDSFQNRQGQKRSQQLPNNTDDSKRKCLDYPESRRERMEHINRSEPTNRSSYHWYNNNNSSRESSLDFVAKDDRSRENKSSHVEYKSLHGDHRRREINDNRENVRWNNRRIRSRGNHRYSPRELEWHKTREWRDDVRYEKSVRENTCDKTRETRKDVPEKSVSNRKTDDISKSREIKNKDTDASLLSKSRENKNKDADVIIIPNEFDKVINHIMEDIDNTYQNKSARKSKNEQNNVELVMNDLKNIHRDGSVLENETDNDTDHGQKLQEEINNEKGSYHREKTKLEKEPTKNSSRDELNVKPHPKHDYESQTSQSDSVIVQDPNTSNSLIFNSTRMPTNVKRRRRCVMELVE